jgi:hypothetical protein
LSLPLHHHRIVVRDAREGACGHGPVENSAEDAGQDGLDRRETPSSCVTKEQLDVELVELARAIDRARASSSRKQGQLKVAIEDPTP